MPNAFGSDDYQPLHSGQLPPSTCRVVHKGYFVSKVFDKMEAGKPNIKILEMAGISCSVENMTQDDCLQILKYKYIDSTHQPKSLRHFLRVYTLHKNDSPWGCLAKQHDFWGEQ